MDFAALVLGPAMAVFGQPIMLTPTKSQPGVAAYAVRGIYASKPVEIQNPDTDMFHRGFQSQLGIRLAEYPIAPKQGDQIVMPQGAFEISDVVLDGQGGADLILQKLKQPKSA